MAVSLDEVKKLAELSRINLTDEELVKMQEEFDAILSYVATIQNIELSESDNPSPHLDMVNVMREDTNPDDGGVYTEDVLEQAPERDGRFIKVKKILN